MKNSKLLILIVSAVTMLVAPAAAQARSRDRDHDGLPDKWEKHFHLSTKHKSANKDPDRDGVDNRNEFREKTNPRRRDSDRDGIPDGREDRDHDGLNNVGEDRTGNDPVDKDTDNDGVLDGDEQAGVVSAFENGVLTIDLAGGGSVTGRVTDGTKVECESEHEAEHDQVVEHRHRAGSARASEDGDHSGPGDGGQTGDEPGDETGDAPGDETGDQPGDETGDESGDDHGDQQENEDACPPGALAVGARVHEAALDITPGGAVFEEIKLLG
jgi:hypothetical protein